MAIPLGKSFAGYKFTRIVVKKENVRQLLISPEVTRDLARRARAIADAANALTPGSVHNVYVESPTSGGRRARAAVTTGNRQARVAQWKHGTLAYAINAGRDFS